MRRRELDDELDGADTVERFAIKHAISRAQAYVEIGAGRLIARKVGARTIVTREDAAKWRRALPKMTVKDAPDTRRPSNGLPTWMWDPKPEHLRAGRPSHRPSPPQTDDNPRTVMAKTKHEKRVGHRRPRAKPQEDEPSTM